MFSRRSVRWALILLAQGAGIPAVSAQEEAPPVELEELVVTADRAPTPATRAIAATTVITQLPDHPLHKDYERMLAAGIKPNLAKLTLARKIAARVLSMWKHQEVYDPQRHRAVSVKA